MLDLQRFNLSTFQGNNFLLAIQATVRKITNDVDFHTSGIEDYGRPDVIV